MKTITVYTVALSSAEAERLVAGEEWRHLGGSTLFTLAAARMYREGIVEPKGMQIFPVELAIKVGDPV